MKELYLGDGLYVSFDGYQYKLRAPREEGDHVVYLDRGIAAAFNDFQRLCEREAGKGDVRSS